MFHETSFQINIMYSIRLTAVFRVIITLATQPSLKG
jgi:hypothetical protein